MADSYRLFWLNFCLPRLRHWRIIILPPTLPSPSRGEGGGGGDVTLFVTFVLINKPESGKVIRGSGGLRKLRWSAGGHGKRGGIRVIYYWIVSQDILLLLFAYPKSEQDDLTPEQLRQLKKVVEGEYRCESRRKSDIVSSNALAT